MTHPSKKYSMARDTQSPREAVLYSNRPLLGYLVFCTVVGIKVRWLYLYFPRVCDTVVADHKADLRRFFMKPFYLP